jgi:hypothetical protein
MKKVIRTINPVSFGTLGNQSGIVYMRIGGKYFNDIKQRVEVNNVYYHLVDGQPRLINPEETIIPYAELDGMITALLDDNSNRINSEVIEQAFLTGALAIIEQKGILNTSSADWEFVDVAEDSVHNNEVIL